MHKNELALEAAKIAASKFKDTLIFLTLVVKIFGAVAAVSIIMSGLKDIAGADPEGIKALAVVVKNLNVSTILGYVVAAGCASGWALERKGKKRLLPKKATARRLVEQNDPYHPSSGLTPTGDTPKAEDN